MCFDKVFKSPFARDERGVTAIIFGLTLIPVIGCLGFALDGWRAFNVSTMAMGALDSAALAAAKAMATDNLDEAEAKELARSFFNANFKTGANGGSVTGFEITTDPKSNEATASAKLSVETTFARIFRVSQIEMERSVTAVFQTDNRDLELAMMLDVTGSMCSPCSKLEDLKIAAKDAIDILISDNQTRRKVRIGLAPYSASVNAGRYAETVSDGVSVDGCVFERSGRFKFSDAIPQRNHYLSAMNNPRRPTNDHYGCPPAEVLPITDDKSLLNRTIDSYEARGWTAGHLGIAWSWYLVSPNWSSIWPSASTPVPYGDKETVKAVILMTDGKFNTSYKNGRKNRTSTNQAESLCGNIKDKDVIVYAVAFQAPESAKETLKDCVTSNDYFFDADNGDELRTAFRDIATRLSIPRLSK